MKIIKIELQHFHGCPNSPVLIERVKEAIKGFDNINYKEVLVDTNDKAKQINFRGSPSLIINGIDFENQPEPENPALACRYYPNGLPETSQILQKLTELQQSIYNNE